LLSLGPMATRENFMSSIQGEEREDKSKFLGTAKGVPTFGYKGLSEGTSPGGGGGVGESLIQ